MVDSELDTAAITFVREIVWLESISQSEAITELLSQEVHSIEVIGSDCEPRASLFGTDDAAALYALLTEPASSNAA